MAYVLLAPEILTALLGLMVLAAGLLWPRPRFIAGLTWGGLLLVLLTVISRYDQAHIFFGGVYRIDPLANFFRLLFLLSALLVLAMAGRYSEFFGPRRQEWFSFMVFATLGMLIVASAGDMITLYLGLELMTISFYILSAYLLGDSRSAEAGLKYLIVGALSSAILLFGMSLVYAATAATIFADIWQAVVQRQAVWPVLAAGGVLMVAGLGFKVAVVPFHMWAPDIYQGAPTPVTAYLAVASKAAGFAALLRIILTALPGSGVDWTLILAGLAALSMLVGNLIALNQHNLKRLLAYSGIAQAGYLLAGLAAANHYGLQGMLFYALIYVFANLGAFSVITLVEVESGGTELDSFNALGRRAPLPAAVMTVCLLSLAGIPPLAGFAGKFYIFSGAVEAGYLWLAFIGLLMSMISVFYYLTVVKAMYIGSSQDEHPIAVPRPVLITLWTCLAVTLLAGLYPAPLARLAAAAAAIFL